MVTQPGIFSYYGNRDIFVLQRWVTLNFKAKGIKRNFEVALNPVLQILLNCLNIFDIYTLMTI